MTKKVIAFDLDGTLAESKQPIQPPMAALLGRLLGVAHVCVISGGDWPQFETQVVGQMPADADLSRLIIMPTTGTKMYRCVDGGWRSIYAEIFDDAEKKAIRDALDAGVAEVGLHDERVWGEKVEDRGSQITFSGLGQEAPLDAKKAWDPDFSKRKALQAAVAKRLPDLSVKVGGSTSIDITRQGTDKAYGMKRLEQEAGFSPVEILFLGDAMYEGGNDYPVRAAGIDSVAVRDVEETMRVVEGVIACLG